MYNVNINRVSNGWVIGSPNGQFVVQYDGTEDYTELLGFLEDLIVLLEKRKDEMPVPGYPAGNY